MRIHSIQTGTVAIKEAQRAGRGRGWQRQIKTLMDYRWTEPLPIYAWVIEHPEGVIVIDTGETARALTPGYFPGWHPFFRTGVREWVSPEEEIGPQLQALGISPMDVRWVILTHLHTDHAGGLAHFPKAEFLVTRTEYQRAQGFSGQLAGYLPQHWPDRFAPRLIDFTVASATPFERQLTLTRAGDVILVPTPGHSAGHMSVILQEESQHIFFAGDTSYTQQLLLEGTVDGVSPDAKISKQTLQRIQAYTRQHATVYLPSHDPASGERLARRASISYPISEMLAMV